MSFAYILHDNNIFFCLDKPSHPTLSGHIIIAVQFYHLSHNYTALPDINEFFAREHVLYSHGCNIYSKGDNIYSKVGNIEYVGMIAFLVNFRKSQYIP